VENELLDWSSGNPLITRYIFEAVGETIDTTVSPRRDGGYEVGLRGSTLIVEIMNSGVNRAQLTVDGKRQRVHFDAAIEGIIEIAHDDRTSRLVYSLAFPLSAEAAAGSGRIAAPMHGTLLEVFVKP